MAALSKVRKHFTMSIIDAAQTLQSLHIPGEVISTDISAAWTFVGAENIIRLIVTADTYVAFGIDTSGAAVSSTTSPAVKLPAGEHYVICTADYVRVSLNPTRVELLGL